MGFSVHNLNHEHKMLQICCLLSQDACLNDDNCLPVCSTFLNNRCLQLEHSGPYR